LPIILKLIEVARVFISKLLYQAHDYNQFHFATSSEY